MKVLTTGQPAAWMEVLEEFAQYDFYHLPQYHALAEEADDGIARLFVYAEDAYTIALPLLLRPLDPLPGLQPEWRDWRDATSVYGYAGPISSHAEIPHTLICNFQTALQKRLREMQVVSVFSRLHPIIPQQSFLAGLGECKALARTVSIDLTLPMEVQRAQFRKNHKEGINKLKRKGVTCVHDGDGSFQEDFIRIYHETMHRVSAASSYFFPPAYFENLARALGDRLHLFVCLQEGRAISAGLFVECHGILQYHLGGTLNDALKLAPMKLLMEEVRLWGNCQGIRVFHLGGGATPQPDDPLLHFKMGFSDRTHDFSVWRWILFPEVYQRLSEETVRWNEYHGDRSAVPDYFPAYRSPAVPCRSLASADSAPEPSAPAGIP
jgi:hypothetical protein